MHCILYISECNKNRVCIAKSVFMYSCKEHFGPKKPQYFTVLYCWLIQYTVALPGRFSRLAPIKDNIYSHRGLNQREQLQRCTLVWNTTTFRAPTRQQVFRDTRSERSAPLFLWFTKYLKLALNSGNTPVVRKLPAQLSNRGIFNNDTLEIRSSFIPHS